MIMTLITQEVEKFGKTKRINPTNVAELDKRIGMEIYLREKKEAIMEDRRELNKDSANDCET